MGEHTSRLHTSKSSDFDGRVLNEHYRIDGAMWGGAQFIRADSFLIQYMKHLFPKKALLPIPERIQRHQY